MCVSESYRLVWRCHLFVYIDMEANAAAARSRLCSRVSAWAGAFARILMSSA